MTAATAATSPSNPLDTLEALPVNRRAVSVVVLKAEVEAVLSVVVYVKLEEGRWVIGADAAQVSVMSALTSEVFISVTSLVGAAKFAGEGQDVVASATGMVGAGKVVESPSAAATGQIVVDTTRVSVVTNVVFCEAGQWFVADGHAVIVAVRVLKTVDVVRPGRVVVGWGCLVSGQTVVLTTTVSVVTETVWDVAGQLGHAVTVEVLVDRIVEVVMRTVVGDIIADD